MYKTIFRRILILIPQLFVISLFVFMLAEFMPGDALTGLRDNPSIDREHIERLREYHGLNDPWPQQYIRWIGRIVTQGDFGRSVTHQRPVTELIGERFANTFWLALLTAFLTYLIALPLGIISGRYNGKRIDKVIGFYTYFALAMPTIVLALVFLLIFGFRLDVFPTGGSVDVWAEGFFGILFSRLYHMILPAITGALLGTVGIIQYLRNEIMDYEVSDFVTTARSKGVPQNKVYSRHIFRNALIPITSDFGIVVAGMLIGTIFIERVFSYPGMGYLFLSSITGRDFTTINALILLFSCIIAVGALISDIMLTVVDPRIRIK